MFRLMKLNPPHGWVAVVWELAIVTLGVIMALAAQQWAADRGWRAQADAANIAFRDELAQHYNWSVEWRVVEPCIAAQLDQLTQRVQTSGTRLTPAPTFSERDFADFVFRQPSKEFDDSTWQSSISYGVNSHLDPALRRELTSHYAQVRLMVDLSSSNRADSLFTLSRPIPLDPSARLTLLQTLDRLRNRSAFIDLLSGQLIDHVDRVGMTPSPGATRTAVMRYGTYKFCLAHGLPMRTFADAMTAVPN